MNTYTLKEGIIMKIGEIFKNKECVFSIECFPPKQIANYEKMQATLRQMKNLNPDFISVTYGAGGSVGGVASCDIASFIKNELGVESVAHVVCMGSEFNDMEKIVTDLKNAKIENVLALRGDESPFRPKSKSFLHASDLVSFIKERGDFFISGACYPEGHPESANLKDDINGLLIKQNAGCDHFFSQMFFDNNIFYRFLNRARKSGLNKSISAGIMPIVRTSQIERTIKLSSASMPSEFTKMISLYQNDEESLYKAGIDYAISQIRDLIESGVDGIHLYAMNTFDVAKKVYDGISDLLK